jgi:signal transduction histidine kinase
MSTDAPESPTELRTLALLCAVVALIAFGVPYALSLGLRAGATVAVAVLAASAFAVATLRRPRSGDGTDALPALVPRLPGAWLVCIDARVHDANGAARRLLGATSPLDGLDAKALFHGDGSDALLHASGDAGADVELQRLDGTRVAVQVAARSIGDARVLLVADLRSRHALAAHVERQRTELETLARRLMTVQEDERASLSRELHDDIGQAITAIKLCASSLEHEPDPPRTAVVRETAQEIAHVADQTVAKLRDISLLLRPPQLDALGLDAALRWQAGTLFRSDYPKLELDIPPLDCRPPRDVELACFRIAQEAMTNVLRHARAGRVALRLDWDDTELRLHIEDDGCGIGDDHRAGLGLITMRERARQLGGTLEIDSRPGRTRIDVTLPLPVEGDARAGALQG